MSDWVDEGPSESDLERFNREDAGYCPECNTAVYDNAEFCPSCGQQIGGRIATKPRVDREAQHRLTIIIVVLIILGFLGWFVL